VSSQINSCSRCSATWTGEGRAHCAACHRLFSVASLFTKHRQNGRCLDPARLRNTKGELVAMQVDGLWKYCQEHPRARD
jgi:hypothetical protein